VGGGLFAEVGWPLGRQEHGDEPRWDAQEAEDSYSLLEGEVIPEFYERDESGLPARWLGRTVRAWRGSRRSFPRRALSANTLRVITFRPRRAIVIVPRTTGAPGSSLLQWKLDN